MEGGEFKEEFMGQSVIDGQSQNRRWLVGS